MTHKELIFATAAALIPVVAQAQNSATPASAPSSISREAARTIIEAAVTYTRDIAKSRMAVVVLDKAGAYRLLGSDGWGRFLSREVRERQSVSLHHHAPEHAGSCRP